MHGDREWERERGPGSVLRGYLALVAASVRGELQYRPTFVLSSVLSVALQLTGFVFLWIMLSSFRDVGGWGVGEVALLYGLKLAAQGLSLLAFGHLERGALLIRDGELDRLLVRPLPLLPQLMAGGVLLPALGTLLAGVLMLALAGARTGVSWSPATLGYVALVAIGGALLDGGLKVLALAFAVRLYAGTRLLLLASGLLWSFGQYPLTIFEPAVRLLLTFGVPVAFVAYLPATVLLGRADELLVHPLLAYLAPLVGVLGFAAACGVWRHEVRQYRGTA